MDNPSKLSGLIIVCRDFFIQNKNKSTADITSSSAYKLLRSDLQRAFLLFSRLVAEGYDGWKVDEDNPGYLFRRADHSVVRFPFYLVPVAPTQADINSVWAISRRVKSADSSVICLSGSLTSVSAIRNFSDIDFCEYITTVDEDDVRIKMSEKSVDEDGRYFKSLRLGRKKYYRDTRHKIVEDAELIAPSLGDFASAKADFIIDYLASSGRDDFRTCDVSNMMIFVDSSGRSEGRKKTFSHQEAILDLAIEIPQDLADPFQLGRYVDWLISETKHYLADGNFTKSCKRALSLARVCHLGNHSDEISKLSRECVNFIDAEIAAIKEVCADLAMAGRSEVVARLEKTVQLLDLEKQKIRILTSDDREPFEDRARRIISGLVDAVEGVSEGKLERVAP